MYEYEYDEYARRLLIRQLFNINSTKYSYYEYSSNTRTYYSYPYMLCSYEYSFPVLYVLQGSA